MKYFKTMLLLLVAMSILGGCGSDSNPLAPFEPEIVNDPGSFQFQITDAANVTVTRSYVWTNTTVTQASIDHSTARVDGAATVVVLDGEGVEVYRSTMLDSGTEQTEPGAAGSWTVQVVFSGFDGTANFRVEAM